MNLENLNKFVSSRGILKSCNHHNRLPLSSSTNLDDDLLKDHRSFSSIYICSTSLSLFSQKYLDKIEYPFILVSGDSVLKIDENFLNQPEISRIIDHPLLVKWYAQNLTTRSFKKVKNLPIGLDYHTDASKTIFTSKKSNALQQESKLLSVLSKSKLFNNRTAKFYSNFHFQLERGDRKSCFEMVQGSHVYYEPQFLERHDCWINQTNFQFILSPEGVGVDCHRTWEALALCSVPIVVGKALLPLFEDLPVIVLEDWSLCTQDQLDYYTEWAQYETFDFTSLFLSFWVDKIRGKKNITRLPKMTLNDFKLFIS